MKPGIAKLKRNEILFAAAWLLCTVLNMTALLTGPNLTMKWFMNLPTAIGCSLFFWINLRKAFR